MYTYLCVACEQTDRDSNTLSQRGRRIYALGSRLLRSASSPAILQTRACEDMPEEVKLFGRWSYDDVSVSDFSLVDYIAINKSAQKFLPHTQGRYQMRRFRKALCPIVERLCCSLTSPPRFSLFFLIFRKRILIFLAFLAN